MLSDLCDNPLTFSPCYRHIIEIPFVFNTASLWEEGAHEAASAKWFGKAWANFAIGGNPGESRSHLLPNPH